MDATCFSYNEKSEPVLYDAATSSQHLDNALRELGMLSHITSSRIEYLQEKRQKSHTLSSPPLCVVQMNSDFVTNFSLSKDNESKKHSRNVSCSMNPGSYKNTATYKSITMQEEINYKRKTDKTHYRRYKPYEPHRIQKVEDPIPIHCDRATSPVLSRQDSNNKSNPSSPIKSQNSHSSTGSSLARSRSLDNLKIVKLNDCGRIRNEIDNVSQCIRNLHVS